MSEEEILYENLKQLIPDIGSLSRVKELRQFKGSINAMRQYSESKNQQIKDLEELVSALENYIDESPCDPDITTKQIAAWNHLNYTKQQYQIKYPKQP